VKQSRDDVADNLKDGKLDDKVNLVKQLEGELEEEPRSKKFKMGEGTIGCTKLVSLNRLILHQIPSLLAKEIHRRRKKQSLLQAPMLLSSR
jgi:hypothetical protein